MSTEQTEVYCYLCSSMKCVECDEHDCQHNCMEEIGLSITSLNPDKIHLIEIIANTSAEFSDVVKALNSRVKPKNNVVYAHRRIDSKTGEPMESSIRIVEND